MRITAGQLVRLMLEIRDQYGRADEYDLAVPDVLHDLILREFPSVSHVGEAPTPQQIERTYLRELMRGFDVPSFEMEIGATMTQANTSDMPPHSQADRVLSEVGLLRANPLVALGYTVMRALHHNHEESVTWAKRLPALWDRLKKPPKGPESERFDNPSKPKGRAVPEEYTSDFIEKGLRTL